MLLAVLLHLLIFHLLTASDAPKPTLNSLKPTTHKDSEYKIKYIKKCPESGYFFKREPSANALEPYSCNLCFCQGDHVAVCWKRDNRKCDKESFLYHGVAKAKRRQKRSPGFSDIFIRDASRDVFNKNTKTQCKPFESSFSDDCPPADWCTGCTVCDCDANGRWDCHLLSFCPDDKNKSNKKHGGPSGPPPFLGFLDKTKEKLITKPSSKKPDTRSNAIKKTGPPKKPNNKGKPQIQRGGKKKQPPPKHFIKKKVPQKPNKPSDPKKMKTPIKYKKVTAKKPNTTKKKIIKKNIATHRPIQIKKNNKKSNKDSLETQLARQMMKTVMQNLRKTVSAKVKTMADIARQNAYNIASEKARAKLNQTKNKPKNVNKRQIKKPSRPAPPRRPLAKPVPKKSNAPTKKPVARPRGEATWKPSTQQQYARNKRELAVTEPVSSAESNTTDASNTTDSSNTTDVSNTTCASFTTDASNTTHAINKTDDTNATIVLTVIPMNIDPFVPDADDGNSSLALTENTPSNNTYYKYTIVTEEPKTKRDKTITATETTKFNKTETIFNLLDEQVNSIISNEKRHIKSSDVYKIIMTTKKPEEKAFKFTKWSDVKISKEKTLISESNIKHTSLTKLMPQTTKTIHYQDKNKTHGKMIDRKLKYRKHNMVKLIQSKCKFENCQVNNTVKIALPAKAKGDFYGYVTKVLNNRRKNITTRRRRKPGVLRYLKGIFNKIFKGKRAPDKMNKRQLIETLCENFGPCSKVNRKDKAMLNFKLSELDKETTKILKTVKIIKGLLKLLELPKTVNSDVSQQGHYQNDIQKLNIILKRKYSQNTQEALTETQKIQIEYIKRSTQDFVESVTKFATLLNELIGILTKEDTNRFRNKAKNYYINKNVSKDNPFQSLRNLLLRFNLVQNTFMKQMYEQLNNFENKIHEKPKVSEVKDLNNSVAIENISRNIIHNLRKLKRLAQTVSYRGKERGRTKRSARREDDAMEYLLMMMEYLIKQNHQLDEPVNDGIDLLIDAIKNAPDIKPIKKKVLDYTPAYYPDTTTTTTTQTPRTLKIFEDPGPLSDDESVSDSDTSDNRTSSTEESIRTKLEDNEIKEKDTKDFVDVITDDEKEFEDKFQFDRRVESDKNEEITEMAFFRRLGADENMMPDPEPVPETTTFRNTRTSLEMETVSNKLESRDDGNVGKIRNDLNVDKIRDDLNVEKPRDDLNAEKTLDIETNILDKSLDYNEARGKKIEVFTGDLDEESYLSSTVSTTDSDIPTTTPTYDSPTQIFQAQKSVTKMIEQKSEMHENNSGDRKARLKWIEENFGKESEKGFVDVDDSKSTLSITPVTVQALTAKTVDKLDDVYITRQKGDVNDRVEESEASNGRERANKREKVAERREDDKPARTRPPPKFNRAEDETESKKTKAKLSAEEVMFRKQMELLNSLDYGTEKSEVFETDSKDSNVDEPNAADSFPSYYV